jgi:rubrerythrin
MAELGSTETPDVDAEEPLAEFRCTGCGYGASCRTAPERCPMCGSTVWDFAEWRPLGRFLADLNQPLARDPQS